MQYPKRPELNISDENRIKYGLDSFKGLRLSLREKLLKETFKPNLICVEIGVLRGEFSEIILSHKPKKLILVDRWECSNISGDEYYAWDLGKCPQSIFDDYEQIVRNKFKDEETVEIIKKSSEEAVKDFEDETFDWIYLDAAHYYSAVLTDLKNWMLKLKRRGYLCGDDFQMNHPHGHGVIEAVHTFLGLDTFVEEYEDDLYKFKAIGQQFYIKKK